MDFFDDAVNKAKEAIDVACQKTNEVVSVQKQKFDIAALESKRAKDFQLLGALYFNKHKDAEIEDAQLAEIVAAVKAKNERIDKIQSEINKTKNKRVCPSCGTVVDKTARFCNFCGAQLEFDSEEKKTENDTE